jgi:hypothetical protein
VQVHVVNVLIILWLPPQFGLLDEHLLATRISLMGQNMFKGAKNVTLGKETN